MLKQFLDRLDSGTHACVRLCFLFFRRSTAYAIFAAVPKPKPQSIWEAMLEVCGDDAALGNLVVASMPGAETMVGVTVRGLGTLAGDPTERGDEY